MQKWEYLGVSGFYGNPLGELKTDHPRAHRMTAKGAELTENFQNRPRGVSEVDAVGQ